MNSVARYCANPTNDHHTAVKRILRYLNGTRNLGLLYRGDECSEMKGYSDQVMWEIGNPLLGTCTFMLVEL